MSKSGTLFNWSAVIIIAGCLIAGTFWLTDSVWGPEVINRYPQTLEYYPAFIATAMGVFLALIIQEAFTVSKQEKRMAAMQKILLKELQRMLSLVGKRKGNHLDTQVWDSLIYSGDASLLSPELQDNLFEIYAMVRAQNIETLRARDTAEAHRREPTADTKQAHVNISIRIADKELELYNILTTFLKSNMLEDQHEEK